MSLCAGSVNLGVRIIRTMADVQKAFNELFDWKSAQQSQNINLNGRRIINAGISINPTDYVTKKELQTAVQGSVSVSPVYYTITFNPPDGASSGSISPPFRIGIGRSGNPNQVWIQCNVAPAADVTFNLQYNGNNLLTTDLKLAMGDLSAVVSNFVVPTPLLAQGNPVNVVFTSANVAQGVTIGLVVSVTQLNTTTQPVK